MPRRIAEECEPGETVVFVGSTIDGIRNYPPYFTVGRTYVIHEDQALFEENIVVSSDDTGHSNAWRGIYFLPVDEVSCPSQRRKLGFPTHAE